MPRSKSLQARRQAAREHDEQRRKIEAAIKAGDPGIDNTILFKVEHPSLEFIYERLDSVAPEGDIHRRLALALLELAHTGRPLDPVRHFIAAALRRLLFPTEAQEAREKAELLAIELATNYFADRGEPAPKKRALKALGLKADTIKKRRQRRTPKGGQKT